MITTVEISMYPLNEAYKDKIHDFIHKLQEYEGLRVQPGPTATMVEGEYTDVMACLTEIFEWSYNTHGRAVYVTKIIPDYAFQAK